MKKGAAKLHFQMKKEGYFYKELKNLFVSTKA